MTARRITKNPRYGTAGLLRDGVEIRRVGVRYLSERNAGHYEVYDLESWDYLSVAQEDLDLSEWQLSEWFAEAERRNPTVLDACSCGRTICWVGAPHGSRHSRPRPSFKGFGLPDIGTIEIDLANNMYRTVRLRRGGRSGADYGSWCSMRESS